MTLRRSTWRERAACRGADPAMFFPEGIGSGASLKVCQGCKVRPECLATALLSGEDEGVWGGMSPSHRLRLRSALSADGRWAHLKAQPPHPARPAVGLKAKERRRVLAEMGPLRHGQQRELAEQWGVSEASISLDVKALRRQEETAQ